MDKNVTNINFRYRLSIFCQLMLCSKSLRTQPAFTYSKLAIESLEQEVKYVLVFLLLTFSK